LETKMPSTSSMRGFGVTMEAAPATAATPAPGKQRKKALRSISVLLTGTEKGPLNASPFEIESSAFCGTATVPSSINGGHYGEAADPTGKDCSCRSRSLFR